MTPEMSAAAIGADVFVMVIAIIILIVMVATMEE